MIEIDKKDCTGCNACYSICPNNCINMEEDKEGFWYPIVNYDICINCGLCTKICPTMNPVVEFRQPSAYSCYNINEEIRLLSSSGGLFSLFGEEIVKENGKVFGAVFDEDFNVVHTSCDINSESVMKKFMGSKYVQSKIGNTFIEAKVALEKGIKVLYSGTPCQIGGLKSFLGKEYDNLFCIDIICHGVPSPKVWDIYKRSVSNGNTIEKINFRDKSLGWTEFDLTILFSQNSTKKTPGKNLYLRGFLKDLYLRPSCYSCKFKSLNRHSDITLADFWGIDKVIKEFNDNKGVSLVIVNSEMGNQYLDRISNKIVKKSVSINEAIKYNTAAVKSVGINKNRDKFFSELISSEENINIERLINIYIKEDVLNFSKKVIIRFFSKIKNGLRRLLSGV